MATITAREFNRDVSAAKRAAAIEPVLITDRGAPAFVLLCIDHYRRLQGSGADLVRRLRMDEPGAEIDIEFEPLPAGAGPRAAQF
ncbi:MAG: type II toxin-antitoxin system Phd/YefM family antitoxin [Actinomycetia bacterium]|nr:type II toxin-antitoxin system Phd/YefM family antitoxin [Actinomycetes bacterium]